MIKIYRDIVHVETTVATVSDINVIHKCGLMGVDEIVVDFTCKSQEDIQSGDYVKYNGINYILNRDEEFSKKSDVEWEYNLVFEHPAYRLLDKLLFYTLQDTDVFTLTGMLSDFAALVTSNMNQSGIDSGWSTGNMISTEYKTISFDSVTCRDALNLLAKEFDVEYMFTGKQIGFFTKIESNSGITLVNGKGLGLYEIRKLNVDNKDTVTRIYPVGGNKNTMINYSDFNGNLILPEKYLQNINELSRIVEKKVVFADIFPHFLGTINSVAGTNNVDIVCSQIDFDLNEIAIGSEARINFITGDLMGKSFEFTYNHTNKKVTLIEQSDDIALTQADGTKPLIPNASKKARANDKFNFTGVIMPQTYVDSAIALLREKGGKWLEYYSKKRIKYEVDIDHRFMRDKSDLFPGSLITISIPQKSLSSLLRINYIEKKIIYREIEDPETNEISEVVYTEKINATVSNYLDEKWQTKIEGEISSIKTTVNSGSGTGTSVDILEALDARPASDRNVMSSLRSRKEFLRKDIEDTAAERITFDKGAVVRDLATKDFVQGKLLGAGAGIYEDEEGNSVIEVDKLNVRKNAWFNEIVINQIRFQGGIVVYSSAVMEVLNVIDYGSYLQVYFDTKNGQLINEFAVDDQIRCQRFSGGSIVKYYMSRVTSIGTDFIRLSKTDIDGTLNVEVGDAIVQFGNRSNTARQSLIEINVLDGGKQTFYQGVNSYTLSGKNYLELGRVLDDGVWRNMIRSYGGMYFGNRDLSSFVKYNEQTGKIEIQADIKFSSNGSYKDIDDALNTAINGVKVGGRNLLLNSRKHSGDRGAGTVSYNPDGTWNAIDCTSYNLWYQPYAFQAGETYTVSIRCKRVSGTGGNIQSFFDDVNAYLAIPGTDNLSSNYAVYKLTRTLSATAASSNFVSFIFPAGTIQVDYIKIEKGTIATDWSAAPEDIQAQIDANVAVIAEITDDNKLTPSEKKQLKPIYDEIATEYPLLYTQGEEIAGQDFVLLDDVGWTLINYLTPILANLDITSDVDGPYIRNLLTQYYTLRVEAISVINFAQFNYTGALNYLKQALAGTTEITGGIVATNVLLMKTLEEGVLKATAGLSGISTDKVRAWFGGNYTNASADANREYKSNMLVGSLFKSDGSGHHAFGKLAWDVNGNLFLKGIIEALNGGTIGNLKIIDDELINDSIKLTTDNLPSLASLLIPTYDQISRQSSWTGSSGYASTQVFISTKKSLLEFKIQSGGYGSGYGWSWELRKLVPTLLENGTYDWSRLEDYDVYGHGEDEESDTKDYQRIELVEGHYYLYATPYNTGGSPWIELYGAYTDNSITFKYYEMRTVLAEQGFTSFFSPVSYLHFKQNSNFNVVQGNSYARIQNGVANIGITNCDHSMTSYGHIFKAGNNWIQIKASGANPFQKSTDGGVTWTNF